MTSLYPTRSIALKRKQIKQLIINVLFTAQQYIDAVLNFPTPSNLTDVRAWFGLTNQVAHYVQLRELVEPMQPLLKKNSRFEWTDDLNTVFESSKQKIVEAIRKGVKIFNPETLCLSN